MIIIDNIRITHITSLDIDEDDKEAIEGHQLVKQFLSKFQHLPFSERGEVRIDQLSSLKDSINPQHPYISHLLSKRNKQQKDQNNNIHALKNKHF